MHSPHDIIAGWCSTSIIQTCVDGIEWYDSRRVDCVHCDSPHCINFRHSESIQTRVKLNYHMVEGLITAVFTTHITPTKTYKLKPMF